MTTVQFRVDRPSSPRQVVIPLPFVVWVFWPDEPREDYQSLCACERIFRVAPGSVLQATEIDGIIRPEHGTCVCPCMGEVIE